MHLGAARDPLDRIKRIHHAKGPVVVKPKTAVVGIGVLPGNHEDRKTLIGQVFDQRISLRQIEDVIFLIQAGTIRIGFGWTVSVDGAYWISSIRCL